MYRYVYLLVICLFKVFTLIIEEPRNMCDNSSLCYPNVTCTGNTTYFECGPCPFGYVGKANGPNGCVRIGTLTFHFLSFFLSFFV